MNKSVNNLGIKVVFSQNLCLLMKEKSRSRQEICGDLNIKYTTLCDWINGRTIPRQDQLEKLGRYFGIEVGEFFIDFTLYDRSNNENRMNRYSVATRRLGMDVIDHLTDEQIKELISSGYSFSHKTLEEYINDSGGTLIVSDEFDWGEPVGCEKW